MFRDLRRRHGRHLERLPQAGTFTRLEGVRTIETLTIAFAIGLGGDHPHVDRHIILQVLIPCDEGGAMFILETDTTGMLVIDPIEVLDRRHDGVGSIMRIDLDSHWYPSSNLGGFIEQQLKGDVLGHRVLVDLLMRGGIGDRVLGPSKLGRLHYGLAEGKACTERPTIRETKASIALFVVYIIYVCVLVREGPGRPSGSGRTEGTVPSNLPQGENQRGCGGIERPTAIIPLKPSMGKRGLG